MLIQGAQHTWAISEYLRQPRYYAGGDSSDLNESLVVQSPSEDNRVWVNPRVQGVQERGWQQVGLAIEDVEDRVPEARELVDPRLGHHPR